MQLHMQFSHEETGSLVGAVRGVHHHPQRVAMPGGGQRHRTQETETEKKTLPRGKTGEAKSPRGEDSEVKGSGVKA